MGIGIILSILILSIISVGITFGSGAFILKSRLDKALEIALISGVIHIIALFVWMSTV